MGEDGHIASIFPNRSDSFGDVFAVDDAPKMPPLRISLSLNRLATTYECILLAIGESKLPAIQALLRKDPSLPATLLAKQTPLTLVTDQPVGNYEDA
jgi:6-phosphogluconolactonase